MTTAALAPTRPGPTTHRSDDARPKSRIGQSWRFLTGFALIVGMVSSLVGMIVVIHDRIGFSPVLSPSMEPAFGPGDLIITRSEPATSMKVGQVVALPIPGSPGQRYVHRLISVRMVNGKPVVRTKGDANPVPEPFNLHVTSKTVPEVIASVPRIGRLSLLAQRGTLRLLIIGLTLICMGIAAKRMFVDVAHARRDRTERHD